MTYCLDRSIYVWDITRRLDMILSYIEASHKTRRVVHESRSEGAVLTVEESAGLRWRERGARDMVRVWKAE